MKSSTLYNVTWSCVYFLKRLWSQFDLQTVGSQKNLG